MILVLWFFKVTVSVNSVPHWPVIVGNLYLVKRMAPREAFCEGLKSPPVSHVVVDGPDVALGSRQRRKSKSSKTKNKSHFRQEANDFMTSFCNIKWIFGTSFFDQSCLCLLQKHSLLLPCPGCFFILPPFLFTCSGCFVYCFTFNTGGNKKNTQAERKCRDVIQQ